MPDPHDAPVKDWPDLAGRIEGRSHILPVRVYFEDTDFSGFAYHASHIRWCERGRSDWLRLLGVHHRDLHSGDVAAAFAVRRLTMDYLKPARIDDGLEIVSSCAGLTTATLTLQQQVRRDGQVLAEAAVVVVLVSAQGRPLRLPARVREAFQIPA